MSGSDIEGLDMMLLQRFAPRPSQTIKGRQALERKKMGTADRRALQRTGRTAQMNLKVRPEFRAEVEAQATARGVLMIEIIEVAWALWLEKTSDELP